MEIKKSNLLGRFYEFFHGELPNDVCSFFWGVVWSLLFLPVVLLGRLINMLDGEKRPSFKKNFGSGFAVSITCLFLLMGGVGLAEKINLMVWWFYAIVAPIIFLIVFGLVIGIIGLTAWFFDEGAGSKIGDSTSAILGAVKKNYCTKINWK